MEGSAEAKRSPGHEGDEEPGLEWNPEEQPNPGEKDLAGRQRISYRHSS